MEQVLCDPRMRVLWAERPRSLPRSRGQCSLIQSFVVVAALQGVTTSNRGNGRFKLTCVAWLALLSFPCHRHSYDPLCGCIALLSSPGGRPLGGPLHRWCCDPVLGRAPRMCVGPVSVCAPPPPASGPCCTQCELPARLCPQWLRLDLHRPPSRRAQGACDLAFTCSRQDDLCVSREPM